MKQKQAVSQQPRVQKGTRLFLVDGHSLCYRAYYAIASLSSSKGEATNAIYGFVSMIQKLVKDQTPDYMAICFDRHEPTFRHEKYEHYKAHRKPMPEDLIEQIEPIKEFCRAFRFPVYEKPGFEADDVIGTLAVRGEQEGFDVVIITGDKDALQLVNDQIKVLNPHKENKIVDREEVKKRFDGLGPEKMVELMALMGDASDNVPGVRGIGEKTALKLIQQFGSVDGLLEHMDQIHSKSQRALIEEHKADLLLSRELVTLDTAVPIEADWQAMKIGVPDEEKLVGLLQRYEFRNMLKELSPGASGKDEKRVYECLQNEKDFLKFVEELKKVKSFSVDTETTSSHPVSARLVGMSFSWQNLHAYYLPIALEGASANGLSFEMVKKNLKPILENPAQKKTGQNIKYDWIVLARHGIKLQGTDFDTMIASYLINPIKLNHNLDDISAELLGVHKIPTTDLIGSGAKQITMAEVPVDKVSEYACEDADCVWRLRPILEKKLEEHGLTKLFHEVELPLAFVLAKMEMNGVSLDTKILKQLSEDCGRDLEALTRDIYKMAGMEFNINSPKQLAEVLFEKLKLPAVKKTKTGYSTDVGVLEKLSESHELPRKILDYRERTKLKSTYLDALQTMILPETHLVHTSYHQTTTATGRLSSSDPNLQNIPIRTEAGRLIRKAFVPRPDSKNKRMILSADYSQIELRILAHLCSDPNLTKAFQEDRDIHKFTATLLYAVKEQDVTREMRNLAKVINFSIIYGKTAYGLSKDLKISVPEADAFIQNYFTRYKKVKEYLDAQLDLARKQGYLTTILGRRSYFPDIQSKNMQIRQFAERAAINAPIQGSAADLIKLAMITIQGKLEQEKLQSLMIMQVHDELVFDVPQNELAALEALVRKLMEEAFAMRVPLKVDIFTGNSWYKN